MKALLSMIEISFGRSTSIAFPEAKCLAETFESYDCKGTGRAERHTVRIELVPTSEEILLSLDRLLKLVSGWKSTEITIDGARPERLWEFVHSLTETCDCYRRRKNACWGDEYCCGKDSPTDDQSFFGCRLEKPVRCRTESYTYRGRMDWFQFGVLSDDLKSFMVDKEAIVAALRTHTSRKPCALCPEFSWDRIEDGVAALPDKVDLERDKRFVLRYSELNPEEPLGIKIRRDGFAIRVGYDDEDEESETLGERDVPRTRYSDVAAQEEALEAIEDVVGLPLKHPDYFTAVGVQPHAGVLLYGPPGNGKTLLAKAVAGESDAHLELINGPEILSKWVGESQANLRRVFHRAKAFAPSVILIDEIDSIAGFRNSMVQQHDVSLISQLLVLLDGLEARGQVVAIGTTNRIEAVDPAIRRPGRFDYHIHVQEPDVNGREAILNVHLSCLRTGDGVSLSELARQTEGFSGADLAAVCREAGLIAIREGLSRELDPEEVLVTQDDLVRAIERLNKKRVP